MCDDCCLDYYDDPRYQGSYKWSAAMVRYLHDHGYPDAHIALIWMGDLRKGPDQPLVRTWTVRRGPRADGRMPR